MQDDIELFKAIGNNQSDALAKAGIQCYPQLSPVVYADIGYVDKLATAVCRSIGAALAL